MAAAFVDSDSFGGGAGGFSGVGDLDAAGADFIAVCLAYFSTVSNFFSDSLGNIYNLVFEFGGNPTLALLYSIPASVGNNMTFSSDTSFSAASAVALSGMAQSSILDGSYTNATGASGTTVQPGSITPSANDFVWIAVASAWVSGAAATVDSPFSIQSAERLAFGNSYATGIAWDIQTTATARNPTITGPSSPAPVAIGQVFKSAGGGGGGGTFNSNLPRLGAGRALPFRSPWDMQRRLQDPRRAQEVLRAQRDQFKTSRRAA